MSDNWSSIYDASTKTFTIPSTVKELSKNWANKLSKTQLNDIRDLKKLIFLEGIENIVDYFYNLSHYFGVYSIEDLILPKSLRFIGESAFSGVDFKNPINIPEGVERIERYAFQSSLPLIINLPKSLKELDFLSIKTRGIGWLGNITVRYAGSKAEWNKLIQDWPPELKKDIKNKVEFI